jgi:malonyl-CoA O-methyltransferase
LLAHARKRHAAAGVRAWLQQLKRRSVAAPQFLHADLATTGLAPESVSLIWSNMALHWHPAPHDVIREWRRILKVDGLVLFSCLGPGALKELRQALVAADLHTSTPSFVDMHDFGDLLVANGFTDPVMDQEVITLTYPSPQRLLQELRVLGGNPARERRAGLTSRAWHMRLINALQAQRRPDGLLALTIEITYGHAWRTAVQRLGSAETRLSLSAIEGRRRQSAL